MRGQWWATLILCMVRPSLTVQASLLVLAHAQATPAPPVEIVVDEETHTHAARYRRRPGRDRAQEPFSASPSPPAFANEFTMGEVNP